MKTKLFAIIILTFCMAATVGCTPSPEYEEAEPLILTAEEAEFISALHEVGLYWSMSPRQRVLQQPPPHQNEQWYMITCPSETAGGFITISNDKSSDRVSIRGEQHIKMSFVPYWISEDNFDSIQQYGLLSSEDWFLFWEFAKSILGEDDCIASVADRALDYFENFDFHYKTENDVTIMNGNKNNVDYRVIFSWHPFLERYAQYDISLTIGLSDFFREYRQRPEVTWPW